MVRIDIDFKWTKANISKIEKGIKQYKVDINQITEIASMINEGWEGEDANLYIKKLKELSDKKSTLNNNIESVEEKCKSLKYIMKKYKDAQQELINKSRKLSK